MDLIYADKNLIDLGVLTDYSFDMEYGNEECSFECRVQSYNHVCEQDYILYIEFTEYGGVIDRVESNTKTGEVVYIGRTWHGILNSFVICPPKGDSYRTFDGTAASVLQEIVNMIGMNDLFQVETQEDEVEINQFSVRYEMAYYAILRMLIAHNAKLYMYWKNGKVHMGAIQAVNYSTNEEFDSSQVPFEVGYTYNNVNHLVCLGRGEGEKRAVIHLFCDDGGNVQPYAKVAQPIKDADYILDESKRVMTGREEIARIYDYPNAEITYNYLPLMTQPSNWNGTYYNYFEPEEDEETGQTVYNNLKREYKDEYRLQYSKPSDWANGFKNYFYFVTQNFHRVEPVITYALTESKPLDWNKNYKDYYTKSGSKYYAVKPDEIISYKALKEKPKGWKTKYTQYFTYFWDGTQVIYRPVSGNTKYTYEKQTKRPTDWETNYNSYYVNLKAGSYTVNKQEKKYKGGYYTVREAVNMNAITIKLDKKKEKALTSSWKKNKFYTRFGKNYAPKFQYGSTAATRFYEKVVKTSRPTWVANKYYAKNSISPPKWEPKKYYTRYEKVEQIPAFSPGEYFYELQDRYAVLVEEAMKELDELRDTSTLSIDLDIDSEFDVGDTIGAIDEVTKIEVNKNVVRKVIRIRKGIVSTEYQVG